MAKHNIKSGEQKAAESNVDSFRKDLGPFVVAAETTRMAMVFTDAKETRNPIIFANDSFLKLAGYQRDEVLGQSFNFIMAQGTDPDALAAIEAEFNCTSPSDPQIRYRRKDDSVFWATVFIHPVRDERGNVVQHFASFIDITKHKQEEERLRFLLDELNHRTQNTLTTVLGIASQTLHDVVDQEVVKKFEGRIQALSKAQSMVGQQNLADAGLRDVLDKILEPFGLDDHRAEHFSIIGDNIRLQPKATFTLAIVFHELAMNALKHGSLSDEANGRVEITCKIETTAQGDFIKLHWQESGGPIVSPPGRKGFGSRLIERGLARELGGEAHLEYQPTGLICEIVMPVSGGIK